jgi:hypothetical protein
MCAFEPFNDFLLEGVDSAEVVGLFKVVVLQPEIIADSNANVHSIFSFSAVSRLWPAGCSE